MAKDRHTTQLYLDKAQYLFLKENAAKYNTSIVRPDPADEEAAWQLAQKYRDKAFSFVDCLISRLCRDSVVRRHSHSIPISGRWASKCWISDR